LKSVDAFRRTEQAQPITPKEVVNDLGLPLKQDIEFGRIPYLKSNARVSKSFPLLLDLGNDLRRLKTQCSTEGEAHGSRSPCAF
jgi:hypothetical protein